MTVSLSIVQDNDKTVVSPWTCCGQLCPMSQWEGGKNKATMSKTTTHDLGVLVPARSNNPRKSSQESVHGGCASQSSAQEEQELH